MDDVVVLLPPALLRLFPGAPAQTTVPATTVAAMIDALDAQWPGMRDRLCDTTPRVRRHINIFIEGQRATLQTPIDPGTEVCIMTAISGG